jgi:16S rRNA (guanine966-N2)-methyltransferase
VPRIVAGAARGRPIVVPPKGTRPTSDRAREALFNTLASLLDLDGARVLDLFAGSGAVGLEALSRGAAEVSFVESDRAAAAIVSRNIATVGPRPEQRAQVLACSVETYLAQPRAGDGFDFVFADPPYALADDALASLLSRLADPHWLRAEAIVVVERSARGGALTWPEALEALKQKRYGEGMLWYGRYLGQAQSSEGMNADE